jgi:hypothetical protein
MKNTARPCRLLTKYHNQAQQKAKSRTTEQNRAKTQNLALMAMAHGGGGRPASRVRVKRI